MRIAQFVPLISADSAFGGPVAVALAQSKELAARGHEVHLYAGWDGGAQVVAPGVHLHLKKARLLSPRVSTVVVPGLARMIRRRASSFDVIHAHAGRDLASLSLLRALRGSSTAVVVQPHGMIRPQQRFIIRLVDHLIVRPALIESATVLYLSEDEKSGLQLVARQALRLHAIRNGVEPRAQSLQGLRDRSTVLFMARLQKRKNVMLFAKAAAELLRNGSEARFKIAGPDEGDGPPLLSFIKEEGMAPRLEYVGAVDSAGSAQLLSEASIYVLPSVGEVYPITVIEALSLGATVVLTNDSAISSLLQRLDAAVIVEPTVEAVVEALTSLLLNPDRRQEIVQNGFAAVRNHFSIAHVADTLESVYGQ